MDNNSKNAFPERQSSQESQSNENAVLNGAPLRRPQTLVSPTGEHQKSSSSHLHGTTIELTIHKDSNGYGMKVSGDNPVFVESVKPGLAANRAGLMAGDMILKVNTQPVRYSSHVEVVKLIKASEVVQLTIQRSHSHVLQQSRPMSTSMSNSPSTPMAQRSSITAPLPVDHAKRKEMEFSKMQTLRLMLEQEKKNLEALLNDKKQQTPEISKAQTNIKTLQEQLNQVCGEDPTLPFLVPASATPLFHMATSQNSYTPAFLSRFPRSLSSLSLGTKKKPNEKVVTSPTSNLPTQDAGGQVPVLNNSHSRNNSQGGRSSGSQHKRKHGRTESKSKADVIPPPLPERNNVSRKSLTTNLEEPSALDTSRKSDGKVSEMDASFKSQGKGASHKQFNVSLPAENSGSRKRSKGKTKAHSDPKMSTQMFLQMEVRSMSDGSEPPPLPPRQPSLAEPVQNMTSGLSSSSLLHNDSNGRFLPNSIDTLMKYPLIATCTTVRDNFSAFPSSHRQQSQKKQQYDKNTAFGLTPQQIQQARNRRNVSIDHTDSKRLSKEPSTDSSSKHSPGSTADERSKIEDTPPGTPPPPYLSQSMINTSQHSNSQCDMGFNSPLSHPSSPTFMNNSGDAMCAAQASATQKPIISMEDDEISDQETYVETNGPFTSLKQLLEHENLAYLAVFLNYVISNSDPSPLLFYLITGLYKEGSVKDMRKWAYEIHSSFLVPQAPLLWPNVDETMAREVDAVLQSEFDKSEYLRKIFWKPRYRAKDFINRQLQEFQDKRIAGLGTMYGPSDIVLMEAKGDKAKEQKIVEETLIPKLQQYIEEVEKETNEDPKKIGLCSALSTVLHRIFVTKNNPGGPIDKVTHYVSREKSFKTRLMGKTSRKTTVKGHQLVLHQYHEVTHCNHCQNIIWGVSPQGYQCENCELNIHRNCVKLLEETCTGPLNRKHGENKISKLMEKIRTTHHFNQNDRANSRRQEDDEGGDTFDVDRPVCVSIMRHPSDRRSGESANNVTFAPSTDNHDLMNNSAIGATALFHEEERKHSNRRESCKSKSAPVSVSRSESYKERSQRKNREKRKTSDPSLGKDIDENIEPHFSSLKNQQKTEGSSTSSISSTVESPSISCEGIAEPPNVAHHSKTSSISGTSAMSRDAIDEELGDDEEPDTDWSSKIAVDVLETMSDTEKKRQEIINEIYITERNHVRTLKLLEVMFMRPLQEVNLIATEHLNLLFPPSLLVLQTLHSQFENKIKQRRQDHEHVVHEIGDLLLALFDGVQGDELRTHAAQFCAKQQIALDALREARKRDDKLHRFLQQKESHKACRRLQLKDLLPTVLQRLTKYPLLFENLHKVSTKLNDLDEKEVQAIAVALETSKKILNHVNHEVRIAEDMHKLQTIQRKLDRTNFEKEAPPEFKNIDLTQHKLIHDGPLNMKKNPNIQLYGLLFESMMVLLQKQDDKYILKFHSNPAVAGENKSMEGKFNPITKINLIFVRQSAVDKNTFFLINTNVSQMLELSAPSSSDCKNWFRHISETSEAYKQRHKGKVESVDEANNLSKTPKDTTEVTPEPEPKAKDADNIEITGRVEDPNLENNNVPVSDSSSTATTTPNGIDTESQSDSTEEAKLRSNIIESNSSRRLTQQSSLIAPSEIQITSNDVHVADRILSTDEKLRRLDHELRSILLQKQEIVCDMFKVPNEHFQAIADIAGQPEAAKEPSDLLLAAFAEIQSLHEIVGDNINVNTYREIAAVSNSLCDNCHKAREILKNDRNAFVSSMASSSSTTEPTVRPGPIEDEDGYCEIEEIRNEILQQNLPAPEQLIVDTTLHEESSRLAASASLETSRTCHGTCYNHLLLEAPAAIPANLINTHLNALSTHISLLMPIINQREKERELLRRENQRLRDMLNSVDERVAEIEPTPSATELDISNQNDEVGAAENIDDKDESEPEVENISAAPTEEVTTENIDKQDVLEPESVSKTE